jgi:hypothetical protein
MMKAFDPLGAILVLDEHDVDFVLIGGLASRLHGSPSITGDTDICHSTAPENLKRLVNALQQIHATLRGADAEVGFELDVRSLASATNLTFNTDFGAVDCMGAPAGVDGYEDLRRNALKRDLDGVEVLVASVKDMKRMKRAAGRPQDLIELEILDAIEDEATEDGR